MSTVSKPTNFNNRYVIAGLIGHPIDQSRSPIIHNYWLKHYGLQGAYTLFPVTSDKLADAIAGLRVLGIAGCNLTLPHKVLALTMVDRLTVTAQRMGAINAIVREADGSLTGHNNDGIGYIASVKEAQPGWRADAGPITVLGSGGAARAIVLSLLDEGAKEVRLLNRTQANAQALADRYAETAKGALKVLPWDERHDALDGAAMLVNTTNQGMYGQPPLDLRLDALSKSAFVSDAIYVPKETPLLAAARARGNPCANGLGMLIHQAVPAFKAWFGVQPEVTPELQAAVQATFG